jgi:hypothetical protein
VIPDIIEHEFELAKNDRMYHNYVGLFKRCIRNGPTDDSGGAMSNWCVITGGRGGGGAGSVQRGGMATSLRGSVVVNNPDASDASKSTPKCTFCSIKTLGILSTPSAEAVQELKLLVEETRKLESVLGDALKPYRDTAAVLCDLREGLFSENWEMVREVLDKAAIAEGKERTLLEEGKRELRLAQMHLSNYDAMAKLRMVFDPENGSFYGHSSSSQNELDEGEGGMSASKRKAPGARRRYSQDNAGDENIDFDTVNVEEIQIALDAAQESTHHGGRSKVSERHPPHLIYSHSLALLTVVAQELKQLLHTTQIVGDLRTCMKVGNWPQVASIFRNLDRNKVHHLARLEFNFVEYQLKAREEQKMLLEGLKTTGTWGFIDNATMETKQLEIAVSNCLRSAMQKKASSSSSSGVSGTGAGASAQGELNLQVAWLLKTCERIIAIRKTIAALAYDDALGLAKNALREFHKDAEKHSTEWKHFVKEELDGYVLELEKRNVFMESVELIKSAGKRCDVVGLKDALEKAEALELENYAELGARGAIMWGKEILQECVGLDKKIAKCMSDCDGVGLDKALKRAERLGLVTEMTKLGRVELDGLEKFRVELARVVGRCNGNELRALLTRAKTGSKVKRANYANMDNWHVVEYLGGLSPGMGTFVQLELAKIAIFEEGKKTGGLVDHRHHVNKMDDVVTLTVRIKQEKVFGVRKLQQK